MGRTEPKMATAAVVGGEVGAVRLLLSRLTCASGRSFGGFGRPAFVAGADAPASAEKCEGQGLLSSLFGDGWLLMGRGDPKTKKGKVRPTTGNSIAYQAPPLAAATCRR